MDVIQLSDEHISALVLANLAFPIIYFHNRKMHDIHLYPQRVANVLLNENQSSYNARYRGLQKSPTAVHLTFPKEPYSPLDIIKLTRSYIYQSCESPSWDNSEAKAIAESILNVAILSLPGYADAPWVI